MSVVFTAIIRMGGAREVSGGLVGWVRKLGVDRVAWHCIGRWGWLERDNFSEKSAVTFSCTAGAINLDHVAMVVQGLNDQGSLVPGPWCSASLVLHCNMVTEM
jgi:hypothetical protein